MKEMELRLLKWQIGGWVALAAIMAKGFGWLGFLTVSGRFDRVGNREEPGPCFLLFSMRLSKN